MQTRPSTLDAADHWADLETSFWAAAERLEALHGTPFFMYFPHIATAALQNIASATRVWGRSHVAYSVKTNPLAALLRDVCRFGALAEVVSTWEFTQAIAAGFTPDHIILNGPLKSEADLRTIVGNPPLTINVDSLDELHALERVTIAASAPVRVGIRICPPSGNGTWSRFGLEYVSGEADEAIERVLRNPTFRLRCIHFHLGTQIDDVDRYVGVLDVAKRIWVTHALTRDVFLDIGGGFPYDHSIPFDDQNFSPRRFFADLAAVWGEADRPILVVEPGRYVAAPAMAIVASVLARKSRTAEPTIIVLDSGTNHNVMAAFYEHLWSYAEIGCDQDFRFCGPLCMEDDILSGPRRAPLPAQDRLVGMFNAGAYSLALARTFIQPRPPIFSLHRRGGCDLLEARERPAAVYGSGTGMGFSCAKLSDD